MEKSILYDKITVSKFFFQNSNLNIIYGSTQVRDLSRKHERIVKHVFIKLYTYRKRISNSLTRNNAVKNGIRDLFIILEMTSKMPLVTCYIC